MNNSSKSSIILDYILKRILVTSCHFFREPPRAALAHNPPRLLSSRSPQSGASGRDLLRRDLGAPGAHEGRPHPLQPAVHDGKLGLQAGTASFDPPRTPPLELRSCFPAAEPAGSRGHGLAMAGPGWFLGTGMFAADWVSLSGGGASCPLCKRRWCTSATRPHISSSACPWATLTASYGLWRLMLISSHRSRRLDQRGESCAAACLDSSERRLRREQRVIDVSRKFLKPASACAVNSRAFACVCGRLSAAHCVCVRPRRQERQNLQNQHTEPRVYSLLWKL